MNKVIRGGRVAVVISTGHGGGWYSWHGFLELLFDPQVVEMVTQGIDHKIIAQYCVRVYGDDCTYNTENLSVRWVPEKAKFFIHEYDGWESIVLETNIMWIQA